MTNTSRSTLAHFPSADLERRYRATFDHKGIGICHTSADGRFLEVNRRLCEILGFSSDELLNLRFVDITHPDDQTPSEELRRQLLVANLSPIGEREKRYVRKDGRVVWVSLCVSVVRLGISETSYFITTVQDITERKRAEHALRESEERFRSLTRLSSDCYWEQDREHRFTAISGAEAGSEWPHRLQAMGKRTWEVPHLVALSVPWDVHRARVERHEVFRDFEYGYTDGVHGMRYFSSSGEPVFQADGSFKGYRGLSREITARKKVEESLRASETRFRSLIANSTDAIAVFDTSGNVIYGSPATTRILGYERGELAGKTVYDLVHPSDLGSLREPITRLLSAPHQRVPMQARMRHKTGSWRLLDGVFTNLSDDAAIRGIVVNYRDITQARRRARQQELSAAFGHLALASTDLDKLMTEVMLSVCIGLEVEFSKILQITSDRRSVILKAGAGWDDRGSAVEADPVADTQNAHIIRSAAPLIVQDFSADARFAPSPMVAAHDLRSAAEVLIAGPAGSYGILGAFSREPGYFNAEDLSFLQSLANTLETAIERKSAELKLAYMAQFDSLTGLANRNLFRDRVAQILSQAARNRWQSAVLVVDLDGFKGINDSLGHDAGDCTLRDVARRLEGAIRPGDTAARLGGDEFAVVLANLAKGDDAALVAARIVAACAEAFDIGGRQVFLSASVGIALYPGDGEDADTLLKNADIALYRAKEEGRSQYQFFLPEMHKRAVERMEMEAQLRGALGRNEFELHYQARADINGGGISGFEALLRWRHPRLGLVSPAQFIAVLEETGLIVPVGEWVIRTACKQIKHWQDVRGVATSVAVNLSARQFQQKGLDAFVESVIRETGIQPSLLELELTESLVMKDPEQTATVLRKLKSYGVRLSVDDFGTGYSSLAYLKRFPLDTLKIDRSFIRDCTTNAEDATIVSAVIDLAHSLKLDVVAEGVETEAQLNFLRLHGCDEMQGYYFARPAPAEQAEAAIASDMRLPDPATAVRSLVPSLLVVDDNPTDLQLLLEVLAPEGYRILTAPSAAKALEILATNSVGMVISDQRMPGTDGVSFLSALQKLYPHVIRAILTGADDADTLPDAINEAGIHKFLSKHWDTNRLRMQVRAAYRLCA